MCVGGGGHERTKPFVEGVGGDAPSLTVYITFFSLIGQKWGGGIPFPCPTPTPSSAVLDSLKMSSLLLFRRFIMSGSLFFRTCSAPTVLIGLHL